MRFIKFEMVGGYTKDLKELTKWRAVTCQIRAKVEQETRNRCKNPASNNKHIAIAYKVK